MACQSRRFAPPRKLRFRTPHGLTDDLCGAALRAAAKAALSHSTCLLWPLAYGLWPAPRLSPALRIDLVQHARIRNALAQVRHAADPRDRALDAHAEPRVRERAVLADVEVPLERFDRQLVLLDALEQQVVVVDA